MQCKSFFIAPLFTAVIFTAAATAQAGTATYDLTSYSFPDVNSPAFTDTVTGTITLTNSAGSALGTYTAGDPSLANVSLSATFTMSSNNPLVSPVTISGTAGLGVDVNPVVNWLEAGSLTATASGLLLSNDGYLAIDYSSNVPFAAYVDGEIDPHDDGGALALAANPGGGVNGGAATMQIFPQNLDAVYGIGGPTGPWQIGMQSPSLRLGSLPR